tara:strand:- start:18 stop:188 length:171 start_codon:yes stop_codon:yes gene_type:complete
MKAVKKEVEKKESKMTNEEVLVSLREQYEHHRAMMFKAQGAIEILEQLESDNSKEN